MQQPVVRRDYFDANARDDRVLVVVFLRGGADGLTLVPPVHDDVYQRSRPTLRVPASQAVRLDDVFSLHSDLSPLMPHFESGSMLVAHGVGSEHDSRSHFAAQDWMEHGGNSGGGWLARYLRAQSDSPSPLCVVSIGTTLPESLRGAPGGAVIQTIRDIAIEDRDVPFLRDVEAMYDSEPDELGRVARDTAAAIHRLRALRAQSDQPENGANYPNSTFGRGLREVAKLIRADVGLAASTIDLDGWDSHFAQDSLIRPRMRDLAAGIDAFLKDLGSLGERVTVVTMTEFGRRVTENTSLGTDHGLASVMFAIGRGINGGRVASTWDHLGEDVLVEPGDVPAQIDFRDILSPILLAHATHIDIARIFPGHLMSGVVGDVGT